MNIWGQETRVNFRRSGFGWQAGAYAAVTALLTSAVAPPSPSIAAELPYNESGITGYFDTTVSIGTAIRTQERDKAIIAIANGGYAPSFNEDDGNLNYNTGDFVSANVKVSHELQIDVGELSFFSRTFYFYDHAATANDTRRTSLSGKAQQYAGHDIQLLDAYVSTDIDVGEFLLAIRIGNQVLNWGESVFIRNGLNSINPIDVSKVRIAGAEVRDVVTPIPAVNLKVGLTDNLSLEGFYQFRWLHTRLEPAGTFFSTTDAASPGGDIIHFGFGDPLRGNDEDGTADPYCYTGLCSRLPRVSDRDARHQGQFGLAVRYFAPELNDAELGLYYARIHSRLPLVSARAGNPQALTDPKGYAGSVQYFREFPEDIDIMGASFNTEIGTSGFAIQGEVSYRRNQPLQIDAVEVILSTLSPLRFVHVPQTLLPLLQNPAACAQNLAICRQAQGLAQLQGAGRLFSRSQTGPLAPGEEVIGFRRKDVLQAQFAISKVSGPMFGADQSLFLVETGFTYVRDMEDKSALRYDGPGTWTSGNPIFTPIIQPVTQNGGFADPFSWGYRMVARTTYNNAIGSVNLSPQISFAHDVSGTTPAPISNFVEDRKSFTLSIEASYLISWQAILSYTNSFDGGAFNLLNDRDFVASTVNYSF